MKKYIFTIFPALALLILFGCKNEPGHNQAGVLSRGQPRHLDRFELEIQKFEEEDKAKLPPVGAVLFTGSSSIRLWSSLEKDFAPIPVVNRGFGGSTLPEVSYYAKRIIYKYRPGVVILYCGENDIAENTAPPVVFQNFKRYIGETEKNLAGTPILFLSAKPSPARWERWREFQQFNTMVEQFAQNRPDLHYLDVGSALLGPNGQPDPRFFDADGLHLNEEGYAVWAGLIRPLLSEQYEAVKAKQHGG